MAVRKNFKAAVLGLKSKSHYSGFFIVLTKFQVFLRARKKLRDPRCKTLLLNELPAMLGVLPYEEVKNLNKIYIENGLRKSQGLH